jgi:hypothetical protein
MLSAHCEPGKRGDQCSNFMARQQLITKTNGLSSKIHTISQEPSTIFVSIAPEDFALEKRCSTSVAAPVLRQPIKNSNTMPQ